MTTSYCPAADIYEMTDAYTIVMDLPGFEDKDVTVDLERNTLNVSAGPEDALRRYARAFTLGSGVDRKGVTAKMSDGVLTLRLPKAKEAVPQRIAISRG